MLGAGHSIELVTGSGGVAGLCLMRKCTLRSLERNIEEI